MSKNSLIIDQITRALKTELPGETAHSLMAPGVRSKIKTNVLKQFAAVIILLYPVDDNLFTVFIKRPEYEGVHGGQIAFPGGKLEIHDENLESAAIRECREELGITEEIEILGELSPLYIPVSGYQVHPFVAFCNIKPVWHPDPLEVEIVLELPLDFLLNPLSQQTEQWTIHGYTTHVPFYKYKEQYKIWGATAMITSEFMEVYKKITI